MRSKTLRSQAGFTYIAALVMVVIIGIMAAKAAVVWKTKMQREREDELLFRGAQIRFAMQRWYKFKPPVAGTGDNQPPVQTTPPAGVPPLTELKSLAQDPGTAGRVRYTRPSNLIDPITGKEWAVIKDGARIIGVASTSEAEPIKQGNFPDEFVDFEGKKKYSEWQFIYNRVPQPGSKGSISIPGGTSMPGGATTPGGSTSGGSGTAPSSGGSSPMGGSMTGGSQHQ